LAQLSADTVQAELAQARAAASEARANLSAAKLDADRARELKSSGSDALSGQQLQQYLTLELTAAARHEAAVARVKSDELRLAQTRITAPDDGLISARIAAVGGVVQPGQELFRLIRKNRLEWRAEVPATELLQLKPGMAVTVIGLDHQAITGRLRITSPSVDAQTRMGLAYVDLPAGAALRAGSFARGEFKLGASSALSLPQTALQLRDGFAYVFQVGADGRVQQRKVTLGRRSGERVELTGGLDAGARVVASGMGFLSDGDLVRVVDAAPAAKPAKPAKPAAPAAPAAPAK
jgi:RND family efflux transporter MFP subunit